MPRIHQITPFLHVPNLDVALTFFCEILPFELKFKQADYAYLEFSDCGLRLLEEPRRLLTADGKARVSVYVDVSDIDALHAQLRNRLETLPSDRVEPLMDKSWNQREFQVRMPDGDWLTSGQPIPGLNA